MARKALHLAAVLVFASACAAPRPSGAGADVVLRDLAFHDGVLEGMLLNRSPRTARVVMLEISFLDPAGKALFAQDFKAVPGGDGRGLLPGQAKHFNYRLRLDRAEGLSVAGRIKAVELTLE